MISITTKFVHTTPRKVRLVLDSIRYVPVDVAEAKLQFTPQAAARDVYAGLHSAIAAAKDQGHASEGWIVTQAFCNEGPRLKRRIIGSRGRAKPIQKQLSHIHITIGPKAEKPKAEEK